MMLHLLCFALGVAGAMTVEIMKAYELRGKLTEETYQKLSKSRLFWSVVLGMCVVSGFLAWALNADVIIKAPQEFSILKAVMAGIGANAFLKKTIEAQTANKSLTQGSDDATFHWTDLFA